MSEIVPSVEVPSPNALAKTGKIEFKQVSHLPAGVRRTIRLADNQFLFSFVILTSRLLPTISDNFGTCSFTSHYYKPFRMRFFQIRFLKYLTRFLVCDLVLVTFLTSLLIARGEVGRRRGGGRRPPTFFDRGDASPTPPTFWTEIRAKVSPVLQLVTY